MIENVVSHSWRNVFIVLAARGKKGGRVSVLMFHLIKSD